MKDRIFVIDGSSYLYRAYHAMPPLSTSKGQPTGAVKGVTNMLMNLKKDSEGSPIIVVFDAKGKTFRNDIYSEYKANRPPMPDELRLQLQPVKSICKAIGFPLIEIEGVDSVFTGPGFLTLTREESADWEAINTDILNKFDTM